MKITFLHCIALAGLLGSCSGAHAGNYTAGAPASLLPVRSSVMVKEVRGHVDYAYDGTGWRTLESGKLLRAGASVRAFAGSSALLRLSESASFVKVSPATSVHITSEAPVDEAAQTRLAAAN
jgi:hypothetical protein